MKNKFILVSLSILLCVLLGVIVYYIFNDYFSGDNFNKINSYKINKILTGGELKHSNASDIE